jgi:hypothetical protein
VFDARQRYFASLLMRSDSWSKALTAFHQRVTGSPRSMRVAAAVAVTLALAAFVQDRPTTSSAQFDDAFIVYRYCRNLVEGYGLTYNIGERVEGFTSLAWVFLVAAGVQAGFDAPTASLALGVSFGGTVLVAAYLHASAMLSPRLQWLAALLPWLLVASTSFMYWSTAGLETPLFLTWVTVALMLDARGRSASAICAAAVATLTRPEGALLAAVLLALGLRRDGWKRIRSWKLPAFFAMFLLSLREGGGNAVGLHSDLLCVLHRADLCPGRDSVRRRNRSRRCASPGRSVDVYRHGLCGHGRR